MKIIRLMVCLLCLVLLVTACGPQPTVTNPIGGSVNDEDNNATYISSGMNVIEASMPFTYELTAEAGDLRQGKVTVTINRSWIVTNDADFPEEGCIRSDYQRYTIYTQYHKDGSQEDFWYPQDLVQDDGSFAGDAYFVMIEMTLTSEDAENWTNEDSYETTGGLGAWSDPYIYNTIGGMQYPDRSSEDTSCNYFSELYSVSSNVGYIMYLYPGETKTVVLGWLVQCDLDTCEPYKYEDLRYVVHYGGGESEAVISLSDLGK